MLILQLDSIQYFGALITRVILRLILRQILAVHSELEEVSLLDNH